MTSSRSAGRSPSPPCTAPMLLPMPHKGQMLVLQVTLEQRVPQSATAVKLEAANWELFCDYPRRVSPVCRRCKSSMWLLMRQPVSQPHGVSAALAGCGCHVQAPSESLGCHACLPACCQAVPLSSVSCRSGMRWSPSVRQSQRASCSCCPRQH